MPNDPLPEKSVLALTITGADNPGDELRAIKALSDAGLSVQRIWRPTNPPRPTYPKQEDDYTLQRVTVRMDFANGKSSELVADDPQDYEWGLSRDPETVVVYPDGSMKSALPATLRLRFTWDENTDD